jgi:hypothetical protein
MINSVMLSHTALLSSPIKDLPAVFTLMLQATVSFQLHVVVVVQSVVILIETVEVCGIQDVCDQGFIVLLLASCYYLETYHSCFENP